jgi:hypothetical protein
MKKKLQKDLRFLKKVWVRVITAIVLALLPSIIVYIQTIKSGNKEDYFIITWIISTILFFIGLYFFVAWLYGDEESQKVNK